MLQVASLPLEVRQFTSGYTWNNEIASFLCAKNGPVVLVFVLHTTS